MPSNQLTLSPQPAPPHQHTPLHRVASTPKPEASETTLAETKTPISSSSKRVDRIDYKALNDGKGIVFKKDI